MNTYIGIDIKPMSITTCLTNSYGETISSITDDIPQLINGWQFQDPTTTLNVVIKQLISLSHINKINIRSIGIACSSGLIMAWDNASSEPLTVAVPYNSSSPNYFSPDNWRKSRRELDEVRSNVLLRNLWESEGKPHQIVSTSKMRDLVAGPIESWLIQVLSSSKSAVIDHATAQSLLSMTKLEEFNQLLPETHPFRTSNFPSSVNSVGKITEINNNDLKGMSGVPIAALVDKNGALMIANNCVRPGSSLLTADDTWTLWVNTGHQPSKFSKTSPLAWTNSDSEPVYICQISLDLPTKTLSWIIDNLKIAKDRGELFQIANRIRSSENVVIIPYLKKSSFSNLHNAFSLLISGIGVSTTRDHIARATFESLAVQISTIIERFTDTTGLRLDHLVIDENLSPLTFFHKMLADQTQLICKINNTELTPAVGAAQLSAIGIGDKSFDSLSIQELNMQTLNPSTNHRAAAIKAARYKNFAQKLGS